MTERSYAVNKTYGLVNPEDPVCLLASFDRISNEAILSPSLYREYIELWSRAYPDGEAYAENPYQRVDPSIVAEYRDFSRRLYSSLGVPTLRNIVRLSIDSCSEFTPAINRLSEGGYRIQLSIDEAVDGGSSNHTIGLIPRGKDRYFTASNSSPFHRDEAVSSTDLFKYLAIRPRYHPRFANSKSIKATNVIALPPEKDIPPESKSWGYTPDEWKLVLDFGKVVMAKTAPNAEPVQQVVLALGETTYRAVDLATDDRFLGLSETGYESITDLVWNMFRLDEITSAYASRFSMPPEQAGEIMAQTKAETADFKERNKYVFHPDRAES